MQLSENTLASEDTPPSPPPAAPPRGAGLPGQTSRLPVSPRHAVAVRALKHFLAGLGLNPNSAATRLGWKNANVIYALYRGDTFMLSPRKVEQLMSLKPGSSYQEVTGFPGAVRDGPHAGTLLLRGEVQAGVLRPSFDLPRWRQVRMALPIGPEVRAAGPFAVAVREPGAEKLYPAGTVLVCVPARQFATTLTSGRRVILQRTVGPRVEVTVRELEIVNPDVTWLWSRGSLMQPPVLLPLYNHVHLSRPFKDGDEVYTVVGVVVGFYAPDG